VRVSLIFAIIVTFMLFTVFTLVYVLYFASSRRKISAENDGQLMVPTFSEYQA